MTGKATFISFETSNGAKVHRLPLQVFPNFWAYAYLVQKDGDNFLIDCGSGTELSHEDLLNGFDQVGLHSTQLNYILLTHAHIDHFGGLSQLKPITGTRIGVHELDFQTVAHHEARVALTSQRLVSFMAGTGLAQETRDQLLNMYRFANAICQSVPVDFTYESLDMHISPFEMIHLPGHCPGHVAIRLDDIIFCGDMVVEGVTPHLSPESVNPYSGLDHYLESLTRFQQWAKNTRLVLNGHDDPILDLHAHIEATHRNIIRRISKAIDALQTPLTIADICAAIYGEAGGYNRLLMIEKSGAYVEYLYEHGMIEIVNPDELEQGFPARYRRLRDISDSEILPKEKKHVLI